MVQVAGLVGVGVDDASIELLPKLWLPKVPLARKGIFHVCIYFPGIFGLQRCAVLVQKGLHGAGTELYVATKSQKIGGLSAKILGL